MRMDNSLVTIDGDHRYVVLFGTVGDNVTINAHVDSLGLYVKFSNGTSIDNGNTDCLETMWRVPIVVLGGWMT